MNWFNFIASFILLIIYIVASVYLTAASANLYQYKDTDTALGNAYKASTIGAVITWVLIGLAIVGIIIYIIYYVYYGAEANAVTSAANLLTKVDTVSGYTIFFLILLLVLLLVAGGLAAYTAIQINTDPLRATTPQLNTAYEDAIIASVLSLTAVGIVFVWFMVDTYYYFTASDVKPEVKTEVAVKTDSKSLITNLKKLKNNVLINGQTS